MGGCIDAEQFEYSNETLSTIPVLYGHRVYFNNSVNFDAMIKQVFSLYTLTPQHSN